MDEDFSGVNISYENWPRGQYTMGVKIPYDTGVPGENHSPVASHWQTLSHNVVSSTPCPSVVWNHNISGDRNWLIR
jgi:hypothetical protein